MTSLADIFAMEKALFKIIFVALFKTFGVHNGDMVIIFVRSFRKVSF